MNKDDSRVNCRNSSWMETKAPRFMTAEWRHLVMRNYEIDPQLLRNRVPHGTEIDFWGGKTFVSLVGFRFLDTRLLGWHIPFHVNFDEVNLRFYVRYKSGNEWLRGVVFIKEIVPRSAVTFVARWVYNENYITLPMRSSVSIPNQSNNQQGFVNYEWKFAGKWCRLRADIKGQPGELVNGSEDEFITEHYWGYTIQRNGSTLEYQVAHPPWRVWRSERSEFEGDVSGLYGEEFARILSNKPSSTFVAEGSPIVVAQGRPVPTMP